MLPEIILSHPYFHIDLQEQEAKKLLLEQKETTKNNCLFCCSSKGKESDEFLLLYKAVFRGNIEVRTLKLSYSDTNKKIINSSLRGDHTSLHSALKALPSFLEGWTTEPFIASPLERASLQLDLTKTTVMPPFPNSFIKQHIFSRLDPATLSVAALVSKSWYALIGSIKQTAMNNQWEADQEKFRQRKEQIKFIIDTIKELIPPAPEGEGKLYQRIDFNGYSIIAPHWYGSRIMFQITTPEYKAHARLDESEITLFNCVEPVVNTKSIAGLVAACMHAREQYQIESFERQDLETKTTNLSLWNYVDVQKCFSNCGKVRGDVY